LQTIFQLSLDLISIADMDRATFLRVNPAFTDGLGIANKNYSAREAVCRLCTDVSRIGFNQKHHVRLSALSHPRSGGVVL
jgi:hypothetical protein